MVSCRLLPRYIRLLFHLWYFPGDYVSTPAGLINGFTRQWFIHCSTKQKFGDDYFRFFLSLVLVQCIVNTVFARVGESSSIQYTTYLYCGNLPTLPVCALRETEVSLQPHSLFSCLAFTYVGAMVASNSALSYVSYPTQVQLIV